MRDEKWMRCVLLALCLLATRGALAEGQSLRVQQPTLVARATPEHPFDEPHLAVDPRDGNHWLAATIVRGSAPTFPDVLRDQSCASFVSLDGGKTWDRHDFPVTGCADPWVVLTDDGQAIASMLAGAPSLPAQGTSGLLVFHSKDGGRTWDDLPIGLGPFHDHPVMAIDRSESPHHGWVYISSHRGIRADDGLRRYGPWIARSRDAGKSFDDPVSVIPNNVHNFAEMPAVLTDGTLVVSFVDGFYPTERVDRDGTFERRRAWVLRSTDGGHTFSVPLFVNDACGPPPSFRLSALAADTSSSSFRDRLYFACREKGGGTIVVNHSADRGERWSVPIPLSSPETAAGVEERIPGLAVGRDGVVAVAWIDGRSAAGHHCEQSVFVTASLDGGQSFVPPVRVSNTPACDDETRAGSRSPTGGDYFGFTATVDGAFRLMWAEVRAGVKQLVTTTVRVER
jgi:BNR repeat-like domain